LPGARRDYSDILKRQPDFYPSLTGLGFVNLADKSFKTAAANFTAALAKNDAYLPAWIGQSEAQLGLNNDSDAIVAMEHVLALDPGREGVKSRLELVRFRQTQALIESGRRARLAGKLDEAQSDLDKALAVSPSSTAILRELTLVELKQNALDVAEEHARKV